MLPIWTVTNIFPIHSLAIVMSASDAEYLLRWWCSRGPAQMALTSQKSGYNRFLASNTI